MGEARGASSSPPAAANAATVVPPLPRAGRLALRVREHAIEVAGGAYGVALPRQACRAACVDDRAALWLGPDEWLLLLPESELDDCAAALSRALVGLPHSLVDISHRHVGIEVMGPLAARLLNAGCPLDLDDAVFPVDGCTRTLLGKAEIVLWRRADHRFHIEVGQSFADYVLSLLREAQREDAVLPGGSQKGRGL